jgi:hypothetical protein
LGNVRGALFGGRGELKQEVFGETLPVAIDVRVKSLGFAIQRCQVGIEYHSLAPDQVNASDDVANGPRCGCGWNCHDKHDKARLYGRTQVRGNTSGARLVTTAVNQLHRSGGRYALCTMCIGVGQGIALVIERV